LDQADLLLHVVDAADPDHSAHIAAVERILEELKLGDKPRLLVLNKCDKLDDEGKYGVTQELPEAICVSALQENSTRPLLAEMEKILWRENRLEERPPTSSESP
jgi:GTP-binding protein HflX